MASIGETKIKLVEEPYIGIQGEGITVGLPMMFVRIQGCPVGCKWCDTTQSWDDKSGKEYSFSEIARYVADSDIRHVWITGGEPTINIQQLKDLIRYIREYVINLVGEVIIHVCTAGVNMDKDLLNSARITLDIKPPAVSKMVASEEVINMVYQNAVDTGTRHEFKIVVSYTDANFVMTFAEKYPSIPITIQPIYPMNGRSLKADEIKKGRTKRYNIDEAEIMEFAEWFLSNFSNYKHVRLGLQLHKHLYPYHSTGI